MARKSDFGGDDLIFRSEFGVGHADCAECPIRNQCHVNDRAVRGEHPRDWKPGGLMIIGEGPDVDAASQLRPFQGEHGRLLEAMLDDVGVDRKDVWLTYATLGMARWKETVDKKERLARIKQAVYHCQTRLLAEIAEAQPRVIVTLGDAAFSALAGDAEETRRLADNPCNYARCVPKTRKVFPAISCTRCSWFTLGDDSLKDLLPTREPLVDAEGNQLFTKKGNPRTRVAHHELVEKWEAELKASLGGECPDCGGNINRLRPREMKCPECGGLKKVEEFYMKWFDGGNKLMGREGVAGAVFHADQLKAQPSDWGVKYVIPTFSPRFLLQGVRKGSKSMGGQFAAPAAIAHLKKAVRLLHEDPVFDVEPEAAYTAGCIRELHQLFKDCGYTRIAADIETDTKQGAYAVEEITCIGFAVADHPWAPVVDLRGIFHKDVWAGTLTEEQDAKLEALEALLTDPDLTFVWHNGLYDRVVLGRMYGISVRGSADTMASHIALFPNEEHGLGFVGHEMTDAPAWKSSDVQDRWPKAERHRLSGFRTWEDLVLYNARDNRVTALADETMNGSQGNPGRLDVEHVREVAEVDEATWDLAVRMTLVGMPMVQETLEQIAVDHREVMSEREAAMLKELETAIPDGFDEAELYDPDWQEYYFGEEGVFGPDSEFSPGNNAMMRDIIFDADGPFRCIPTKMTATGAPSGAKDVLATMTSVPFIRHLLTWREYSYRLSHYIEGTGLSPDPMDGRLHPSWMPKLVTGRWSTSPNMQNWPKIMRSAFRAPKGRKLVGADYDQLELRGIAVLAEDETLIDKCMNADDSRKLEPEWDPHSFVTAHVFGDTFLSLPTKPGDDHVFTKGVVCVCGYCQRKLLRDIEKRVIYGLNYGSGAQTILDAILDGGYTGPPLSIQMIERVIATIFELYPGIPIWRDAELAKAYETREVRSPILGRRRIFPFGEIEAPVVYNFPIQSLGGDIMNLQTVELDAELPNVDETAAIIAQVHDAIYIECAEERAEDVAALMNDVLTVEWAPRPGVTPMLFTAGAKIADLWNECG